MLLGICCAAGILTAFLIVYFNYGGVPSGSLLHIGLIVLLAVGCIVGYIFLQFLLAWIISLVVQPKKAVLTEKRFFRVYMEMMLGLLLHILRVHCTVTGKEKLPKGRFLLVSNHRSNFDPLICLAMLPGTKVSYISKPENFQLPIVGAFMRYCRFMSIDRENARNAVTTINRAVELLRADECSIGIYPEGTRSKNGELLPFRSGSFKIATKAKVPIVVAHVWGTERICKQSPWRRSPVRIDILQVIQPEEFAGKHTAEISEQVHDAMLKHEQTLRAV